MVNEHSILVIGRHKHILEKVTAMLKQHGYTVIGKQWNDEAIEAFKHEKIEAVIIGGGVDIESRKQLYEEFTKLNPFVKIIDGHPHSILEDLQKIFPSG